MLDSFNKTSSRFCKDLCYFFIEKKKLKIFKDPFRFCMHLDSNQKSLDLLSLPYHKVVSHLCKWDRHQWELLDFSPSKLR